ncbi:HAD family hydrolase [Kineosporia babensis]|uniref:HAD family phosphatase n=1 Tax=Kineosporia babensis TaxID=499548 RepID=A0A9X1SWB5_9ACTN|nr:HAD family phosphatase [Kineosporia babensis]MCD5314892.1 HAD family phosphatase [Kineosporia babensis]
MPVVTVARTERDLQPPATVRALVFDWDGTLFDNHHFNYTVMRDALAQQGVRVTSAWFEENSGFSARLMVQKAGEAHGLTLDPLEVLAVRDELAQARVHEIAPVAPVHELLRTERLLAVVTGSERSNIQAALEHFGLQFDVIVTRDQITRGKPDPEGYLLALRLLGVAAHEAVVYEDSDQGISAALAAGIDVVDVRAIAADRASTEPD